MSNGLWHLHGEGEALGGSGSPVANGLNGGARVEGRVHLDSIGNVRNRKSDTPRVASPWDRTIRPSQKL